MTMAHLLGSPTEEKHAMPFPLTEEVKAMLLKKERKRHRVPSAPINVALVQYSEVYYKKVHYVGHGTYGPLSAYVCPGR